jgi:FkbH-like protein
LQAISQAVAFGCPVIQSIPLPIHVGLVGSNEHRLPGSRQTFIRRLSERIRRMANIEGVDVLSLDTRAAIDGVAVWHDADLWFHAKQEVAPRAAPFCGDLLVRLLAAQLGLSAKCLVLDLDNTLWGGVVGDDGVERIELGQGSATGEAFVAVQQYAKALSQRGVILAVCSKNDEHNALAPFERHPEMVLRRADIACFVANWNDKPSNLRMIAKKLSIGLDALVFLDDNPFERALVRRELPMVAVPEINDDPSSYPRVLEDAGYFEATRITPEDRQRVAHYRDNADRTRLRETTSDLASYLASLDARLIWRPFDRMGLARIIQLANKTNQFNLTTRRYSEADVLAIMNDSRCFGLQLRLVDRFGDNGMIAIVVGRLQEPDTVLIENWLMSCRVLGRGVETATLGLLAEQAIRLGAGRLVGEYRPTAKNGMVRELFPRLGFSAAENEEGEFPRYSLMLSQFKPQETPGLRIEV